MARSHVKMPIRIVTSITNINATSVCQNVTGARNIYVYVPIIIGSINRIPVIIQLVILFMYIPPYI